MDPVIIVVAILALVVIAALLIYRQRGKVEMTGPFGTKVSVDGSNDPVPPTPGINIGTAISHEGSTVTEDQTGRGIDAERLEAKRDVRTTLSRTENNPDPKG